MEREKDFINGLLCNFELITVIHKEVASQLLLGQAYDKGCILQFRRAKTLIYELTYMEFPLKWVHVLDHRNSALRFTASMAPLFLSSSSQMSLPLGLPISCSQFTILSHLYHPSSKILYQFILCAMDFFKDIINILCHYQILCCPLLNQFTP